MESETKEDIEAPLPDHHSDSEMEHDFEKPDEVQDADLSRNESSQQQSPPDQRLGAAIANEPEQAKTESSHELTNTKSLEQKVSLPRELLIVGLISMAQFLTQTSLGQVLAIIHIIGDHFQVGEGTLPWLIAGYSLTVGTFILVAGRLGDLFGWKRMLVIGYLWFALWSIILGASYYSNHVLFIFARVFQGLGPSLCFPNAIALLGGLYAPGKRKAMAFAVFGGIAPAGAMFGFLFGSLFALAWWPWAFFSLGITLAVAALGSAIVIPDPQSEEEKPGFKNKTFIQGLWDMDILGATVGITALVLFNFSWNQAPSAGWSSPYIIVTLILSLILFPIFFYIEAKVSTHPLVPFSIFTADNAFVLGCVACGWANFGIWVYYLIQILETIRGISPLLASAYLSPMAVSGMVAAITTGFLLSRLRPAWVMLMAMCAFLTGTILTATLPPHQIYWAQLFVTFLVATFGMDMSFPSATLVLSNSVEKANQGVAASLVTTIINYSISLGLGFAGTVEVNVQRGGKTMADILHGYRGALYMAIGLDGLGLFLAATFVLRSYWIERKQAQVAKSRKVEGDA